MQQITVNLTIPIPEDSALISKVEYTQLKDFKLEGVFWNMSDLEKRVNKKSEWIKLNILYHPSFKAKLKDFVYYPSTKGETWSFQAKKMAKFLEDHFDKIFN